MTDKMKKILRNTGWLVMAAALVLGMTACSSEDDLAQEQTAGKTVSSIGVTVSAGFADGEATTRSAVVTEDGKLKLTFTTGDRLFVRGVISGTNPEKIVAGYLTIVSTPAAGATEASFSGTLDVYVRNGGNYEPSTYTFADADDPLAQCNEIMAWLIHKDAGSAFELGNTYEIYYNAASMAASVNELMTTCLPVCGTYNGSSFPLKVTTTPGDDSSKYPILNVSVTGGLEAGGTYSVILLKNGNYMGGTLGNVQADADGKASFACYTETSDASGAWTFRFINISSPYDWKKVTLGSKALESKIYNASRAAVADEAKPSGMTFPTITGAAFSSYDAQGECYVIDGGGSALDFTLSGTAEGVSIAVRNYTTATATLSDGFNATAYFSILAFDDAGKAVNVVLDGNSTIEGTSYNDCLYSAGSLKMSGTGVLTTKSKNSYFCGIHSNDNYAGGTNDKDNTSEVDVSTQLAADGYKVTRGERTLNAGTYTWTYTVVNKVFADATAADLGKVIGADGNIYDNATAATNAGTTARAMITYVGSATGEAAPYNHGLALAMSDAANGAYENNWSTSTSSTVHAYTASSSSVFSTESESGLQYNNYDPDHNTDTYPAFKAAMANNGTAAPTGCSAWFLPTAYQWNQMISACSGVLGSKTGGETDLQNGFSNAGGTNLEGGYYWSSTEQSAQDAWRYYFGPYQDFKNDLKTSHGLVRSCLAF